MSTSKVTHTPTPWRECGAERGGCKCRQIWSKSADVMVAIAVEQDEFQPIPPEIAAANASHICKCVNSHDALLEACKAAAEHFDGTDAPLGKVLRDAVKLAEGQG